MLFLSLFHNRPTFADFRQSLQKLYRVILSISQFYGMKGSGSAQPGKGDFAPYHTPTLVMVIVPNSYGHLHVSRIALQRFNCLKQKNVNTTYIT